MGNEGCSDSGRRGDLAAQAGAEIVARNTQFAGMRRLPLALVQHMLDRVRRGKCLRAEQQESQQEMGKVLFHDGAV
jgi:hypothetical protein